MNAVVLEHVPVSELPEEWRAKLSKSGVSLVTERIEEELPTTQAAEYLTDDPAFGIWRDREDMADVTAYVRDIREPRYSRNGSRKDS
jgi:hypothetical protein